MRSVTTHWVIALLAVATGMAATTHPSAAAEQLARAKKPAAQQSSPAGETETQTADEQHRLLEDNQRRIKELENTVNQLKKDQRQTEASLESQKPLASWADGFWIKSADDRFKLKIGAYTQADGRFFIDDSENRNVNQFTFRRARLDLQGTVFKYFDFRILPDFAGASFVLFDAYMETNFWQSAKLRVGKFKPPVGLERLQSATSTMFIERGLPTNLVPARDNGVQLGGDVFNGAFSYQLGIFNGVPDLGNTATDANDDKDVAGRIFAHPLRNTSIESLQNLGFGIAASYGREGGTPPATNTAGIITTAAVTGFPGYRTFGQATFFQYVVGTDATNTALAIGEHTRIAPQAYYYVGPFGFLGEYTKSAQAVRMGTVARTLSHDAWQLAGSYVITGEPATFKGVAPAAPFDPFEGKWGALEVAGRYGQLEIDSDAFKLKFADPARSARRAKEWVLGANWYLNKNIKVVLDYANTAFRGGSKLGDRRAEHGIFTRVQLAF